MTTLFGSGRARGLGISLAVVAMACGRFGSAPTPVADPPLVVADSVRRVLLLAGREVVASVSAARDSAAICIAFAQDNARFRLEPDELRALSIELAGRRPLLDRPGCPRTFASMVALVDSFGNPRDRPPPGYVDPRYVQLVLPARWEGDQAIVTVRVAQGTGTTTYECRVARAAATPVAACRAISRSVS